MALSQYVQCWVQPLAALLTPTIALVAVYIAWQQWRTNRNKLKFELFERRYAFYEAAKELIGKIVGSGKATDNDTYQYLVKVKGARFIVGDKVADYLEETLYRKVTLLTALHSELEGVTDQDERRKNVQRQREVKEWIQAQYDVLDKLFKPLLRLNH
jgi:hypothetical protein